MVEETERVVFTIIARAGEARTEVFSALDCLAEKDVSGAREKIERARKVLADVHDVHTQLIQREARGDGFAVTLLLTHAQDILMVTASELAIGDSVVELFDRLVI